MAADGNKYKINSGATPISDLSPMNSPNSQMRRLEPEAFGYDA
ncbi:hypothetical protein TeGR_g10467, partial [Tetraparma gracilis]